MKAVRTGLLCLVLAVAAWMDAWEKRVPNRWLLVGAAAGICCRGKEFFPPAGMVLLMTFLLFRLRMIGAGDGKLMAMMAGYLGMEAGMEAIFSGLLVGALWSLCRLWNSNCLKARLIYLSAYFMRMFQTGRMESYGGDLRKDPSCTIPLAVCMAAGTYLYLMVSGAAAVWSGR